MAARGGSGRRADLLRTALGFLAVLSLSGTDAHPSGAGRAVPGDDDLPAAARRNAPDGEGDPLLRPFGCPDLAATETFRARGLEYVHTSEFADALFAVATGASRFSPPERRGDWEEAALRWRMHLVAHEVAPASPLRRVLDWERYGIDETSCPGYLVYLASREFQGRPGNDNAKLVLPFHVPTAAAELAETIDGYIARGYAIAARIDRAERLGAGACAPTIVPHARIALDRARRSVAADADPGAIENAFAAAERKADDLLNRGLVASGRRFVCYSN